MCFRPLFGKAKMCLGGVIPQLFVYNFQSKCAPLKRILAFPTYGQKSIFSELWALENLKLEVGHPVHCTPYLIPCFDLNFHCISMAAFLRSLGVKPSVSLLNFVKGSIL